MSSPLTLSPNLGPGSPPHEVDLINAARELARRAILLDAEDNLDGAIKSYEEALKFLTMASEFTNNENHKLEKIRELYQQRIDYLIVSARAKNMISSPTSSAFLLSQPSQSPLCPPVSHADRVLPEQRTSPFKLPDKIRSQKELEYRLDSPVLAKESESGFDRVPRVEPIPPDRSIDGIKSNLRTTPQLQPLSSSAPSNEDARNSNVPKTKSRRSLSISLGSLFRSNKKKSNKNPSTKSSRLQNLRKFNASVNSLRGIFDADGTKPPEVELKFKSLVDLNAANALSLDVSPMPILEHTNSCAPEPMALNERATTDASPSQRSESDTLRQSLPPNRIKEHSKVAEAREKARIAVQLDSGQDIEESVLRYQEAVKLLDEVMLEPSHAGEIKHFESIRDMYLRRIQQLTSIPKGREPDTNKSEAKRSRINNLKLNLLGGQKDAEGRDSISPRTISSKYSARWSPLSPKYTSSPPPLVPISPVTSSPNRYTPATHSRGIPINSSREITSPGSPKFSSLSYKTRSSSFGTSSPCSYASSPEFPGIMRSMSSRSFSYRAESRKAELGIATIGPDLFEDPIGDIPLIPGTFGQRTTIKPISDDSFEVDLMGLEDAVYEPPPSDPRKRIFWLFRSLERSLSVGAFITERLYIPREIWMQNNVRVPAIETKIQICDILSGALHRISAWERLDDLQGTVKRLEFLQTALGSVQNMLAKKEFTKDQGSLGSSTSRQASPTSLTLFSGKSNSPTSIKSLWRKRSMDLMSSRRGSDDSTGRYMDSLKRLLRAALVLDRYFTHFEPRVTCAPSLNMHPRSPPLSPFPCHHKANSYISQNGAQAEPISRQSRSQRPVNLNQRHHSNPTLAMPVAQEISVENQIGLQSSAIELQILDRLQRVLEVLHEQIYAFAVKDLGFLLERWVEKRKESLKI
ncbi:uncharacterized protein VTP21DRAFT_5222 [Calcarisporiella thermophila]|uniref:uncharacterized protein n=1 Tax=Calcarisporiella thermophila TaxID=911321 RepID=UPI003743C7EF